MKTSPSILVGMAALCLVAFPGCRRQPANRVQGYVEGEFVFVASPNAGQLETVSVKRGDWVKTGDPLFALECGLETAAKEESDRKLAQGKSNLEDAKKARRPPELESAEAQLKQARAAFGHVRKGIQTGRTTFFIGVLPLRMILIAPAPRAIRTTIVSSR